MKKHWKYSAIILSGAMLTGMAGLLLSNNINTLTQNNNVNLLSTNESLLNNDVQVLNSINDIQFKNSTTGAMSFAVIKGDGVTIPDYLYAWGNNTNGQLGIGAKTNPVTTPTLVQGFNSGQGLDIGQEVTHVISGSYFTIVVINGNQIWATGWNNNGEFGNGTKSSVSELGFVNSYNFPADKKITSIAAGAYHVAAVLDNAELYTWGSGFQGRLGLGDEEPRYSPTQVTTNMNGTLGTVKCSIASTMIKTTVDYEDRIYMWGNNTAGELGDLTFVSKPTPTLLDYKFIGIITGYYMTYNSVFLTTYDGSVNRLYAWGANGSGQLGLTDKANKNTPTLTTVPTGISIKSIVGGNASTTFLTTGGVLYTTGISTNGQSGFITDLTEFTLIPDFTKVTAISSAVSSSIAISDAKVYAWGSNASGTYGDATIISSAAAVYKIPTLVSTFVANPSALVQTTTDVSTISVNTAAERIYKNGVFSETAFKEYVNTASFPAAVVFTMDSTPVVIRNGVIHLIAHASQCYTQPYGAKTTTLTTFTVAIAGFKSTIVNSELEYINPRPEIYDFNNITGKLGTGSGTSMTALKQLIYLDQFPTDAEFKLNDVITTFDETTRLGTYSATLTASKHYVNSVVNSTPTTYTFELSGLTVPPVEEANWALIIGLSVGIPVGVVVIAGLIFWVVRRRQSGGGSGAGWSNFTDSISNMGASTGAWFSNTFSGLTSGVSRRSAPRASRGRSSSRRRY